MNELQTKLYNDLMAVCAASAAKKDNSFYFVDQVRDGHVFRIFLYRLAQYTDYSQPNALNCRGTMFELERGTLAPMRLASWPMEKFFNVNENPFTQNLNFTDAQGVFSKEDGSLISTYHIDNTLFVKSKGSLWSEQAVAAQAYIDANQDFKDELADLTDTGYTIDMEWCAPENRIVLPYREQTLFVLGARHNESGWRLWPRDLGNKDFRAQYPEVARRLVKDHLADIRNVAKFVEEIPKMENIEGFVIVTLQQQRVKVKTEWYLTRHRLKDSVNNPAHLFEAIVTEAVDDIKTMFAADELTLGIIADMEKKAIPAFNTMIATVEQFHRENKDLDRKSYAIKAQEMCDGYMPLYMNLFLGRTNPYAEFAVKNYKRFIGDSNVAANREAE